MEQAITIPLITSFFTTWRASLSDCLEGSSYAKCNALIGAAAGLGIITGPAVSSLIMNFADPRYCFLASSFFSATCFCHLVTNFKETLPEDQRKPLVLSDMQPLSFLQLMRTDTNLNKLMWITGLQTTSEGRNVNDIFAIYMQEDLGWSFNQINTWVGALGVALVVSGVNAKRMVEKLGMKTFTTFSNLSNAISFFSYSFVPPFSYMLRCRP
jgi:MFS family permease